MDNNSVLPPAVGADTPATETSLSDATVPSMPSVDPATPVTPPAASSTAAGSAKLSTDSPTIAEDVDLIEKEWVAKAKAIVSRTAQDPNLQSKELGKYKADYLKTRFNKEIKASE